MVSILTLLVSLSIAHDYHMGKTEITVNETDKRLEITQFIFIDDLEKALSIQGSPFQNLGTSKELQTADSLVLSYFSQHLEISYGNTKSSSQLKFVGKEISDDLTGLFIYMTQELDPKSGDDYTVTNTTFLDLFDDQVNLIYFEHQDGSKDYFVLNGSKTTKLVD